MTISQSLRSVPHCKSTLFLVLVAVSISGLSSTAVADDKPAEKASSTPAIVFPLNRSASEVAKSLGAQLSRRTDVQVSADVHSNVLIVRGDKKAVEEVKGFLKVLDTPFQTVTYQVSIAVSGEGKDKQILDELELSTLDNNKASIQFGQQVAVPTGVARISPTRSTRSYSQQSTGTIVQVQPRVSNGKILTDFMLEKSWLDAALPESEDEAEFQYSTFNISFESTLALQDGVPQTVKAKATGSPNGQRSVVITVTATTKAASKAKTAARSSAPAARDTPTRSVPPYRLDGARGVLPGRPVGPPSSQSARSRTSERTIGSSQLFSRIDRDKDNAISKKEWAGQPISKVFADRGFEFTDGMNEKQFEAAMAEMVRAFRKRPDTEKESSKSPPVKDDAVRGTADSKSNDRDKKDGDKTSGKDRRKRDGETDES